MSDGLNDDFSTSVVIDTMAMDWQPSPSPTVWRKRLDRRGPAEEGRVTSVVRYDPESSFHGHPHPDGEEILVLAGVFSDQTGDYPAGSFLLNAEGFEHAPFSKGGCLLFVKLKQYPGLDRHHVLLKTDDLAWEATGVAGVEARLLYRQDGKPETIVQIRLSQGASFSPDVTGGAEIFVMEGSIEVNGRSCGAGTWLRQPAGQSLELAGADNATLYLKTGHLADV